MEYLILYLLQEPLTFRELENLTAYDRNILNCYLQDKLQEGLIQRVGSRRQYVYFITTKGLAKLYAHKLRRILEAGQNE